MAGLTVLILCLASGISGFVAGIVTIIVLAANAADPQITTEDI